MQQKQMATLSDQELLKEAKKLKLAAITNALLIGFFVGIIVYSVVKNTVGLVTLIPLFFVYKMINRSKYNRKALENLLKERNLK